MRTNIEERSCELARYIIEHRATCRAAAKHFSVSKSTVHKDVTERLREFDLSLYTQVQAVVQENKAQRHLRGGEATRQKYLRKAALTHGE